MKKDININPDYDFQIDRLVSHILGSKKYQQISNDLIYRIGSEELKNHQQYKIAVKETRKKLHQVVSSFNKGKIDFNSYLTCLEKAYRHGDDEMLKACCIDLLTLHASTQERVPILPLFFKEIFTLIPPVESILDIGCGYNPFAIPWMPLPNKKIIYHAWDVSYELEVFLNKAFQYLPVKGIAHTVDFLGFPNVPQVDLIFILKSLPCFFQQSKSRTIEAIHQLPAKYIVVSYPTKSLSGKKFGMEKNYAEQFFGLAKIHGWQYQPIMFESELVFIVTR